MQNNFTVFLTGLSGSGKTTLALELRKEYPDYVYLDGDVLRSGLNSDLSFSVEDREENIRRVIEISKLMNENGKNVVATFIMPLNSLRERAKRIIQKCYIVYVNAPIEVCEERDPKGLYKKVRQGIISNFTGIDSPFEEPTADICDLIVPTDQLSIEESSAVLKAYLHHWSNV